MKLQVDWTTIFFISRKILQSTAHIILLIQYQIEIKLKKNLLFLLEYRLTPWACVNEIQFSLFRWAVFLLRRQCSECDQASSDEADIAMETLPDGTKRSRRQIKGPIKFIPQEMSPEPKKHQVRGTVCVSTLDFYYLNH